MNPDTVAQIFQSTDRELWILAAADGERSSGLIATTVTSASIVPEIPRVLVAVAIGHYTWELIEAAGAFALHLFDEGRLDWAWRFGLQSGRDVDKFEDLSVRRGKTGSPILTGAAAWLECRVENRMETGDRTVYLAEVIDAGTGQRPETGPGMRPLTANRLIELADPGRLQELKRQLAADAARDANAIREWRKRPPGSAR